jgi:hypothetical protein
MKLYIAVGSIDYWGTIFGVFTTKEKAEEVLDMDARYFDDRDVVAVELDKPVWVDV